MTDRELLDRATFEMLPATKLLVKLCNDEAFINLVDQHEGVTLAEVADCLALLAQLGLDITSHLLEEMREHDKLPN